MPVAVGGMRLEVGASSGWRFEVGGLNTLPFSLKPLTSNLKPALNYELISWLRNRAALAAPSRSSATTSAALSC